MIINTHHEDTINLGCFVLIVVEKLLVSMKKVSNVSKKSIKPNVHINLIRQKRTQSFSSGSQKLPIDFFLKIVYNNSVLTDISSLLE